MVYYWKLTIFLRHAEFMAGIIDNNPLFYKIASMMEIHPTQELQRLSFQVTLALYRVTDFFPKTDPLRTSLRSKANEVFESILEYRASENREQDMMMFTRKIASVRGYLGIAREMRFLRTVNFTVLEREYERLESKLVQELEEFAMAESGQFNQRTVSYHSAGEHPLTSSGDTEDDRQTHMPVVSPASHTVSAKRSMAAGDNHARVAAAAPIMQSAPLLNERQKIILGYMGKTGQLKISDLFDSFAGISSKTIQRDLQSLINFNLIKKEGDKRWTIYSLQS